MSSRLGCEPGGSVCSMHLFTIRAAARPRMCRTDRVTPTNNHHLGKFGFDPQIPAQSAYLVHQGTPSRKQSMKIEKSVTRLSLQFVFSAQPLESFPSPPVVRRSPHNLNKKQPLIKNWLRSAKNALIILGRAKRRAPRPRMHASA